MGGDHGVLGEAREFSPTRLLIRAPIVTARETMAPQQARMSVQWFVPRGEMGAINSALHVLMVATRAEPGCLSCLLSTQLGDRAGFTYVEEWKTEEDLVMQLRSARFAKLAQLLESATERPRIEFSLPGGIRGIDYAEEVRGRQGEAS
jgi:quinol monooxygenase YgiN